MPLTPGTSPRSGARGASRDLHGYHQIPAGRGDSEQRVFGEGRFDTLWKSFNRMAVVFQNHRLGHSLLMRNGSG